jgi:hypothetical protein
MVCGRVRYVLVYVSVIVAPLHRFWFTAVSAKTRFCVNDAVPSAAIVVFMTFAGNVKSAGRQLGSDVVTLVETVSTWTVVVSIVTVTVTGVLEPGVIPVTVGLAIVRLSVVVLAIAVPEPASRGPV